MISQKIFELLFSITLPVWPDLAKFRHFGKILTVFGIFFIPYLIFGKMFDLLWYIFAIRQIFIVVHGQI